MKKIITIFALITGFFTASAQAPSIAWQNTIGGADFDRPDSIIQTSDGGYLVAGTSESDISGDKTENSNGEEDYWVIKLNNSGTIVWQNTIGGSLDDTVTSVEETTDGGFIVGGRSNSDISGDKTENSNGNYDYWVLKLNASGSIEWQNTIGGSNFENLTTISQTTDGGYIIGGYSNSDISGDKTENSIGGYDYWVVKLDASGTILWQNTIGGSNDDFASSISQTTDGGYIFSGKSNSDISGDKTENSNGEDNYWVVKLDATGTILWQNTIGGNDYDFVGYTRQTTDGEYILGGWSYSNISGDKTENSIGGADYWVLKLNDSGIIQWQNTIGGTDDDYLDILSQTTDGGYILGGTSYSDISGDKTENGRGFGDIWAVKLNSGGTIEWDKTIGADSDEDEPSLVIPTADGGYLCSVKSESDISGDKTENSQGFFDYWIIKLDGSLGVEDNVLANTLVYPNPFNDRLHIKSESTIVKLSCKDILGRSIFEINTASKEIDKIDVTSLSKGIYFITLISDDNETMTTKLIKK